MNGSCGIPAAGREGEKTGMCAHVENGSNVWQPTAETVFVAEEALNEVAVGNIFLGQKQRNISIHHKNLGWHCEPAREDEPNAIAKIVGADFRQLRHKAESPSQGGNGVPQTGFVPCPSLRWAPLRCGVPA